MITPSNIFPRQISLNLYIKIFDGGRFLTDLPLKYLPRQKSIPVKYLPRQISSPSKIFPLHINPYTPLQRRTLLGMISYDVFLIKNIGFKFIKLIEHKSKSLNEFLLVGSMTHIYLSHLNK